MMDEKTLRFRVAEHPHLTFNGEHALNCGDSNLAHYGFDSPKNHYIYTPDISADAVARHWGLNEATVEVWIKKFGWDTIRESRVQKIKTDIARVYDQNQMMQDRLNIIEEGKDLADRMIKPLLKNLEEGVEEIPNPTGGAPTKLQMKPTSQKALTSAIIEAFSMKAALVGVSTKATGNGEATGSVHIGDKITTVVIERPPDAKSFAPKPEALKPPKELTVEPVTEPVEGGVVDG